ncbi:hypothetical protein HOLleu_15611 [Holothuria leucospilota]|uniref:CCHC-type domain-containing protein n=1 Tax=Holothuria leucospilota TaxID=206669 RepID=A0A9Q1C4F5_HOLLE|nr:hypothetical protein HOLleu_15611 [Holothuria leucospilota]
MDIEKLVSFGEKMGLSGKDLQDFVTSEKTELERLARDERAHQLEMRRMDKELLDAQLELETKKKEANDSLNASGSANGQHSQSTRPKIRAPKLPPFEDTEDLDAYLQRYERYATNQGWQRVDWAINLSALLKGKALEVYSRLPPVDANDYDKLKEALLKRFQLTEDGFRQKFRSVKPEEGETASQFACRLENYLVRWMKLAHATESLDGLKDLVIREQFTNSCSKELSVYLKERQPKSMAEMAKLADSFVEAHGGLIGSLSESSKKKLTQQADGVSQGNRAPRHDKFVKDQEKRFENRNKRTCFVCGKTGHFAKDCNRWRTVNKLAAMQLDRQDTEVEEIKVENVNVDTTAFMIVLPDTEVLQKNVNGFISLSNETKVPILSAACSSKGTRCLPVTEGLVGDKKVSVLRDTGCTGVVVRKDLVKSNQFTGETVCCILIDGTVRWLPVAVIRIETKFIKGDVRALCMDNPIYDLIVGNVNNCEQQVQEGKVSENCDSNIGMLENVDANEVISAVETRAQKLAKQKPFRELKVPKSTGDTVSAETLQIAQSNDDSLAKVREAAESGEQKMGKWQYFQVLL